MSAVSKAFQETDDAIKHLLRQVVYMFYPHQSIIIMEAILFHNVLFEDDLIKLCCMHKKVFRSFCNKLIDDKLIVSYTQKEETQPYKLFTRTYYYIHNIEAIDSIKWKIHKIVKHVKEEIGNFSEPQGYICPTCHHKYTLLDAASLLTDDKLNFECSICGDYLIDDDISKEQRKGQEKLEKLMSLLEPIIQYLKIIDDLKIDDNNFDTTLIKYVPAFSDSLALYSISNKTSTSRRKKFDNSNNSNNNNNNDNINQKSQATIHVSITADDEDLKRERQKREERNRKLRQNALPSWHQESTVGKTALGRLDSDDEELNLNNNLDLNNNQNDEINIKTENENNDNNIINTNIKIENENENENENEDNKKFNENEIDNDSNTIKLENNSLLENDSTINSKSIVSNSNPIANIKLENDSNSIIKNNNPINSKSINNSIPGITGSTSTEEMDALSAYYSQLRQRQEEEEEEEEEEDEEEEDEEEELEEKEKESDDIKMKDNNEKEHENSPIIANDSINKDDIDEDDFDLDMFASDNE